MKISRKLTQKLSMSGRNDTEATEHHSSLPLMDCWTFETRQCWNDRQRNESLPQQFPLSSALGFSSYAYASSSTMPDCSQLRVTSRWKCHVVEIYTRQTWNHKEHYCNLAGRQTDVLGGVALHSEDFISSLRRNHIGLLGLSIPSAEAWRPKMQFPVELGHHCQTVPATTLTDLLAGRMSLWGFAWMTRMQNRGGVSRCVY